LSGGDGNAVLEGKDAFRESTRDWLDIWESVHVETDAVEAHGVRDGRIARVEWFPDHERAVAAAHGA
jgi:ketosteroid isomerase-like protein